MTLGSLFDGIGAFPLAASRHGIKPAWASEIEPPCVSVTKRHFPSMKHLGDITKISGAETGPAGIITFGSPCQDLSIAGKRAGIKGKRSSLFLEAVRIIKEMRGKYGKPRFIVWENVPGAFSANRGRDFKTVIEEIAKIAESGVSIPRPSAKCGWLASGAVMGNGWSLAWRVMDAQYWGVPQRRKRIFLVADFGGQSAPEILFKPGGLQGDAAEGKEAGEGTATSSERSVKAAGFRAGAGAGSDIAYHEELASTLKAGSPDHVVIGIDSEMNALSDAYKVRRLTPLECEHLMGFPGGWTEYGHDNKLSDTARYRALGNSIAVPCLEFIMGRLAEHGAY